MKTSHTKLKSSLVVLITLGSMNLWAKPIAQVQEVKGRAFVISEAAGTKKVQPQDIIDERDELLVEDGGQLSLNDYYNSTYYLTGGSHIKIYDRSIQLKKGKTWVKSQSRSPLAMTTANGNVEFLAGQFIATFDQATNRSQFLVVQGEVNVSNVLDRDLIQSVPQGQFTVIDPEVENGIPRAPTKVGAVSLNRALEEFQMKNEAPMQMPAVTKPARSIASVTALEVPMQVKKGQIIFMTSTALPEAVTPKKTTRMPASVPTKKTYSDATISYYGTKTEVEAVRVRLPASTPQPIQIERTLKKTEPVRPGYSNELESLINDLKSY